MENFIIVTTCITDAGGEKCIWNCNQKIWREETTLQMGRQYWNGF